MIEKKTIKNKIKSNRIEVRREVPSLPAMVDMVWKAPLYGIMPAKEKINQSNR